MASSFFWFWLVFAFIETLALAWIFMKLKPSRGLLIMVGLLSCWGLGILAERGIHSADILVLAWMFLTGIFAPILTGLIIEWPLSSHLRNSAIG